MNSKPFKKISFLLTLLLLFGVVPFSAFAANDKQVLTSVEHVAAVSAAKVKGYSATLTVPYSYPTTTVVLASGLKTNFNNAYTSENVTFPSGATAIVGGDSVLMRVTYQKQNETIVYTSDYNINVVRAAYAAPAFSGIISKQLTLPESLTFKVADFSANYKKNDGGELAYIVISGNNFPFGSLKLDAQNYNFGEGISVSSLESGALTFEATDKGTASYTVQAYAQGDMATAIGQVTLTITVKEKLIVLAEEGVITYAAKKDEAVAFKASDFNSVCQLKTGKSLSYVMFTLPASTSGVLYCEDNASSATNSPVLAGTKYYMEAAPEISDITFAPAAGFLGETTIPYTGYTADQTSYTGTVKITFKEKDEQKPYNRAGIDLSLTPEAIKYLTEKGILADYTNSPNASLSKGDFIQMLCKAFNLKADQLLEISDLGEDIDEDSEDEDIKTPDTDKEDKGNSSEKDKSSNANKGKNQDNDKGAKRDSSNENKNSNTNANANSNANKASGNLKLNSSLSRQDAMVLIVKALKAANITISAGSESDLKQFSDSKQISDYAADAISALVKSGFMQGYGDKIIPHGSVSRAEMAVILYRILKA